MLPAFFWDKIAGFLESGGTAFEIDYGSASIQMFRATKAGRSTSGIAHVGAVAAALGDTYSHKAVLDTRSCARKSILTNIDMTAMDPDSTLKTAAG